MHMTTARRHRQKAMTVSLLSTSLSFAVVVRTPRSNRRTWEGGRVALREGGTKGGWAACRTPGGGWHVGRARRHVGRARRHVGRARRHVGRARRHVGRAGGTREGSPRAPAWDVGRHEALSTLRERGCVGRCPWGRGPCVGGMRAWVQGDRVCGRGVGARHGRDVGMTWGHAARALWVVRRGRVNEGGRVKRSATYRETRVR